MSLIDADVLFREIKNSDWLPHERINAMKMVREQPTIDAVPVVRCKDCKFWFRNNGHDKNGCPITDSDIWMDDSDFCSYGERIDNESHKINS